MDKQEFIKKIAGCVQKYAPAYGILVHSPIIAQAILESGWGESRLAAVYHNYFGLKCGTKWTGKSVNLSTMEEYTPGTLTQIKDNFRVYDNMEEGVKGYFEFIQLSRYQNLRGITDPETYLKTIKADGYATSSKYVDNTMRIVTQYDLQQYDVKGAGNGSQATKSVAAVAKEVIAGKWGNGEDRKNRLTAAGYNYKAVQDQVNALLKGTAAATKSVAAVAKEVIAGKWGNGKERKNRLEAAGYNYNEVQAKVNAMLR